ncbi:MAG: TetR/AcrR family transcriptional regulator [Rhizomicrobium sp.]
MANGSLFNYFETKADLFNQVYRELKAEMGAAAPGDRIAKDSDTRRLMFQMWSQWMRSATACPDKRRTLAHLGVSDDITPESRAFAHAAMAGVRGLLQRSRKNGSMRHAPLEFVAALMGSLADTTIDFMIRDPGNADKHGKADSTPCGG